MRIWRVHKDCQKEAEKLSKELHISTFLASILINKGFTTKEQAYEFLHPEQTADYDPFLLPDMDKAVERIKKAINQQESIVIYGDYDADGATATAIMVRNLRALGAKVEHYNPDRFTEGYGMNAPALEKLHAAGAQLIITVDCGISNGPEIDAMKGKLDFIVTDHHQPGEKLPEAVAVVDAHREDSHYPYKYLCGGGVAYKLCQALWKSIEGKDKAIGLELAGIATIADVVPLTGENRRIAYMGLRALEHTSIVGLKSMLAQSNLAGKVLAGDDIGYRLGPQINSAGRLEHVDLAIDLLLTDDKSKADKLAKEIYELNEKRKEMGNEIIQQVEEALQDVDIPHKTAIVLGNESWHQGLIGNSANKIMEKYCRPTFLMSIKDGLAVGSARSIDGFHLFKALCHVEKEHKGIFVHFGGHAKAAGFTIREKDMEVFRSSIEKLAGEALAPADYIHKDKITLETNPLNVTLGMVEELAMLEPCGEQNKSPLFACRGVQAEDVRRVGQDGLHLQFSVGSYPDNVRGIAFHMGEEADRLSRGLIDMTYCLKINEFNGRQSVQFQVEALESPLADGAVRELTVENMRLLYKEIMGFQKAGNFLSTSAELMFSQVPMKEMEMDVDFLSRGVKVLSEAGLLELSEDGSHYVLGRNVRVPIEDTSHFKN